MKWTYKQKVKMVREYLEKGITPRIPGFNYEYLRKQVLSWSYAVKKNGYKCLNHSLKTNNWTYEDKCYAISQICSGRTQTDVAAELGMLNNSIVWQWYKKYQKYGFEGLKLDKRGRPRTMKQEKPKRVFKSKDEELEYLRAENAVLKKLAALVQARKERESKKK